MSADSEIVENALEMAKQIWQSYQRNHQPRNAQTDDWTVGIFNHGTIYHPGIYLECGSEKVAEQFLLKLRRCLWFCKPWQTVAETQNHQGSCWTVSATVLK